MRATIAHGHAETLGGTDGNVSTQFTGRCQNGEGEKIRRHDGKSASAVQLVDEPTIIAHLT